MAVVPGHGGALRPLLCVAAEAPIPRLLRGPSIASQRPSAPRRPLGISESSEGLWGGAGGGWGAVAYRRAADEDDNVPVHDLVPPAAGAAGAWGVARCVPRRVLGLGCSAPRSLPVLPDSPRIASAGGPLPVEEGRLQGPAGMDEEWGRSRLGP